VYLCQTAVFVMYSDTIILNFTKCSMTVIVMHGDMVEVEEDASE